MTSEELEFSIRKAKIREMKERRERKVEGLIEIDPATKEAPFPYELDDSTDEEASMDFLDLAMRSGLHEESSGLDIMIEAMSEFGISRQVY